MEEAALTGSVSTRKIASLAETPADRPDRLRLRLPTSLVITLAGATLSVLILPAITKQWEDRQKARELKASLVDEIAAVAARSAAEALRPETSRADREALMESWNIEHFRIKVKLRAYFPKEIVNAWRTHSNVVSSASGLAEGIHRRDDVAIRYYLADFFPLTTKRGRQNYRQHYRLLRPNQGYLPDVVIRHVATVITAQQQDVIDMILAAHPAGFSTTGYDLIDDLLPG
jgi:hypothetical protein